MPEAEAPGGVKDLAAMPIIAAESLRGEVCAWLQMPILPFEEIQVFLE